MLAQWGQGTTHYGVRHKYPLPPGGGKRHAKLTVDERLPLSHSGPRARRLAALRGAVSGPRARRLAARCGAGHAGMMPSGVHGSNVCRYLFLSPLTLSSFHALLTLSGFLRILQVHTTKCIDMAPLPRRTLVVLRQRGQGMLTSCLLAQLCASKPARWAGLGFALCCGVKFLEGCAGVAALRRQGRCHVVASMKGQAPARAGKAGAVPVLTRKAYPGCSSHRTGGGYKEVVVSWWALGSSGRTPNHQPSIQTRVGSVSHSLYTGRPHTHAATRPLAPPSSLTPPRNDVSPMGQDRRIEPNDRTA